TGPASAQAEQRNAAQPRTTSVRPTYIGLRVNRYMPDGTSVVACSGLNGLIVVLARLNSKSPASATAPPTRAMAMNTAPRTASGNWSKGPAREASHIAAPITNATTGGGIFSSSALIGAFCEAKNIRVEPPPSGEAASGPQASDARLRRSARTCGWAVAKKLAANSKTCPHI